ncbi:threonine/homoserine/homoserine lactone efflux protein [Promicromonospora sp. AC04]|uniref:LysE family translocator n=1 Tax=Promicromonospora sp. AC04 TaxID=2135723 RepID=UPI000D4D8876|nr:LysE family translocator [Promicromonospora sp. AC04]PUB32444.1 threonine/homoserine/homoserine lactone efflux protein [Promicromonospora sp. AC04]
MLVSWTAVLGVALVELGMALTPGPNMVHLASRSIGQGTRAGLTALAGTAVGFLVYLVAAALGFAALFIAVPALFVVVKVAGAIYLGYLAWEMLRPGGRSVFDPAEVAPVRPARLFGMGLVTNLLNPKIALLYAALLPQFIDPSRPVWSQFLVLGGVQIVIGVMVNGLVVLGAARLAGLLRGRSRLLRVQRWVSGTVLAGFAVKLAFERQPAT